MVFIFTSYILKNYSYFPVAIYVKYTKFDENSNYYNLFPNIS